MSIDISDCAALDDRTQIRGENVISAKIAESQGMMPAIFLFNEGRYRRAYPTYNNKLCREKYWEHVGLASPRDRTDGKFSSRCCRATKANCVALFVVFNSMSVEDCLTRRHIRVVRPVNAEAIRPRTQVKFKEEERQQQTTRLDENNHNVVSKVVYGFYYTARVFIPIIFLCLQIIKVFGFRWGPKEL